MLGIFNSIARILPFVNEKILIAVRQGVESSMIGNTLPQKNMMHRIWFFEPEKMMQFSSDTATAAGGLTLTGSAADVTLGFRRR